MGAPFFRSSMFRRYPAHTGNGAAGEGDKPEAVNCKAYPVKGAVDDLGAVETGGDQRQKEMESHAGQ